MYWVCLILVVCLGLYTPEPSDTEALLVLSAGVEGPVGELLGRLREEVQGRRGFWRVGLHKSVRRLRETLEMTKKM
jgi:hypothetical protein